MRNCKLLPRWIFACEAAAHSLRGTCSSHNHAHIHAHAHAHAHAQPISRNTHTHMSTCIHTHARARNHHNIPTQVWQNELLYFRMHKCSSKIPGLEAFMRLYSESDASAKIDRYCCTRLRQCRMRAPILSADYSCFNLRMS